jgi:hypothetical protein
MGHIEKQRRITLRTVISVAVVVTLSAANAQAAMLGNVNGAVSVDNGYGFRPAPVGLALAPGDRVRTDDGSADILYKNGCSSPIAPHQLVVVLKEEPVCTEGGLKDVVSAEPAGPSTSTLLVGGLVVGGAVGLALALTNAKPKAVSP